MRLGLLDKYGKPNDKTPSDWLNNYVDYSQGGGKSRETQSSTSGMMSYPTSVQEPATVERERKVIIEGE